MYQLTLPQNIIYGDRSLQALGRVASELGSKALIITDKLIVSLHLLEEVCQNIEESVSWQLFDDVDREPTSEIVAEALTTFQEGSFDLIIAVGGGSCIDTGKAVAVMAQNPGSLADFATGKVIACQAVPLIAIPTTAGTGSEVTDVTVITEVQEATKYMIKQPAFLPKVAIVDPRLSVTSPATVTAATGVDALCHALESFISSKAHPATRLFSLSAIKLILENLIIAYQQPHNIVAREKMAQAAMEAGIAFSNSSVTLVHGMSRPLGALFQLPHGIANGVLLETVMSYTKPAIIPELATIARYLAPGKVGTDRQLATEFLADLHTLLQQVAIPKLKDLAIEKSIFISSLDKMASDAIASGSPAYHPLIATKEDIKAIYLASW